MNFKKLIGTVAPFLGTLIGGPFGGAAGAAIGKFLLGNENASEKEIEKAIANASPETLLDLRKLDAEERIRHAELAIDAMKVSQQPALAQVELNKTEATHGDWWARGWRPAIGWVCASVLAIHGISFALVSAFIWVKMCIAQNTILPFPAIPEIREIMLLILGGGIWRTIEKIKGVAK